MIKRVLAKIFHQPDPALARSIAREGYIYGFPIVLMEETRNGAICEGERLNTLFHLFSPPDSNFRDIVSPNVDTLYSSAFLELSRGPIVLQVPQITDRFYLMAMLDAWSNNFAGPGTQSNNGQPTTYFITGPNWSGTTPRGMIRINAPTHLVWLIGRTEVKGPSDVSATNAVQRSYKLYPYAGSSVCTPPCRPTSASSTVEAVEQLSALEFFRRLDSLIRTYPPASRDASMLVKLGRIGVGPHARFSVDDLSRTAQAALSKGVREAQALGGTQMSATNGWSPPTTFPLGDYGTRYRVRYGVALVGFGANKNEYAVYQNAVNDTNGVTLDGSSGAYELRFVRGNTPPVNAFWSVTVYDTDLFLSANEINRYALGSNSGLEPDSNGDVVIKLASSRPSGTPVSNWLPVPLGQFSLTLRMYWPQSEVLSGNWMAPGVTHCGA